MQTAESLFTIATAAERIDTIDRFGAQVVAPGAAGSARSHLKCLSHECSVGGAVSRFEYVSGLSVYWPIIALASAEWQSSAVTPQFNPSFSVVSRFSKHLIEFIAIDS